MYKRAVYIRKKNELTLLSTRTYYTTRTYLFCNRAHRMERELSPSTRAIFQSNVTGGVVVLLVIVTVIVINGYFVRIYAILYTRLAAVVPP